MSEVNERNLNNSMPEEAENKANAVEEAVETVQLEAADDKENAPRSEAAHALEEEKPAAKKKGKKKRRKKAFAILATAILLVIALVFGAVVGYTYGRNMGIERAELAEAKVAELTAALEEAQATPVYDAFEEELTQENREALDDLAGTAFTDDGDATVLMGEEIFGVDASDESGEAPVVVAEYDGGQLMSDEVAREYGEQMTNFVFAGYNEEEVASVLLDEVLKYMVSDRVLEAHAKEMGLYELTEADRAQIDAQAQANFDEQLQFYRDYVNTEGMTEEEATGAVKAYMQAEAGVTLDIIRSELEEGWWAQKIYDEITKDVTVDDAALEKAYKDLIVQQKESYETYPDDFEFAQMNGETIVYNLPGYRAVRMLLLGFEDDQAYEAVSVLNEEITELDAETDAQLIAEYKAEIDGFYAAPEARAQEVLEQLQGGASFDELLASIGDDDGMKDEDLYKTGYYISEKSMLWSPEIISAAMALKTPGDISGAVRTADGVCILEYVGEVQAGEVPLEKMKEELQHETLENAKYSAYEQQLNKWLEEANVKYYPERMQ
ncbi:MAG: hypothetical protein J6M10_07180 [Clostridia bacterium]|nr:hypothetical protein [Clostridia bacterium]